MLVENERDKGFSFNESSERECPRKVLALLLLSVHGQVAWQRKRSQLSRCLTKQQTYNPDLIELNSMLEVTRGTDSVVQRRSDYLKTGLPFSRSQCVLMRIAEDFERIALAGFWTCCLDLDDGLRFVPVYLDGHGGGTVSYDGSTSMLAGRFAWKVGIASVENDDLHLQITMKIGGIELQGKGRRVNGSRRCEHVSGWVLEGDEDPFCVGRFNMNLTLPAGIDDVELDALEEKRRVAQQTRRSSEAKLRFAGLPGQWKLFIAMDGFQSLFVVELRENGRVASVDTSQGICLAGTWGLFDRTAASDGLVDSSVHGKWGPKLGTHLWLHVERDQCVGLSYIKDSFSLLGTPEFCSLMAEVEARSDMGSDGLSSISGYCYYPGVADRYRYVTGRFTLSRGVEGVVTS